MFHRDIREDNQYCNNMKLGSEISVCIMIILIFKDYQHERQNEKRLPCSRVVRFMEPFACVQGLGDLL